jgi:hypothetical protein
MVTKVQDVNQAYQWLDGKARAMIRASARPAKGGVSVFPPQVHCGYEAFWLRDYSYMLEGCADAFSDKELREAYRFLLNGQRSDGTMVDCITFDGTPIYMPGYGTMGENPVADGSQFMVNVAYKTCVTLNDKALLSSTIGRLESGMQVVPTNPETGLVFIDPAKEHDRCPYGFADTVREQGDTLFASLLYIQASQRLSELYQILEKKQEADKWAIHARQAIRSVRTTLWDSSTGLFRAATVKCREHDIWGSAFAVFMDIADEEQTSAIARYFVAHYSAIVKRGQLRHLPGGIYWEQSVARDTYQNGAYWATPIGWFVYALDTQSPELADKTVVDMVNDFIKTGDVNECINDGYANVPEYINSASLPLNGIRRMLDERYRLRNDNGYPLPASTTDGMGYCRDQPTRREQEGSRINANANS